MTHKKHLTPCHICYTDFKTIISSCGCSICPSCWQQLILTKIQETNSIPEIITCPIEKCLKQLSIATISQKLSRSARDEISQATLKVYLSKTPDIRQCPSAKCNYAGIIDLSSSCSENPHCKACKTTWREKVHYTSIENSFSQMTKQRNEIFSELWKKMKYKKCPKCKVSIDKNGGCGHMTCSKCNYKFCWVCMQGFSYPGHNTFLHYLEVTTKPVLFLLIFFFMLYALYLLPSVHFVIYARVVPEVRYCWFRTIKPIFSGIWTVFGPIFKFSWFLLKVLFECAGDESCQALLEMIISAIK